MSLRLELWEKSCPPSVCRVRQGDAALTPNTEIMRKCDIKDLRGACFAPFKRIRQHCLRFYFEE